MEISEIIARAEIADVLHTYAHGADRCDWALVRSCYHPDAYDDHGLYAGGLDGLMVFLEQLGTQLTSTTHQLSNMLIEIDRRDDGEATVARSETSCFGYYTRPGRGGTEWAIAQGLRYLDQFERHNGQWKISRRNVVLDWEKVFDASIPSIVAETWARGAKGIADPSNGHLRRFGAIG